jgi:hypothetical protein
VILLCFLPSFHSRWAGLPVLWSRTCLSPNFCADANLAAFVLLSCKALGMQRLWTERSPLAPGHGDAVLPGGLCRNVPASKRRVSACVERTLGTLPAVRATLPARSISGNYRRDYCLGTSNLPFVS